jgi:Tfp pilus assembly protein PilN
MRELEFLPAWYPMLRRKRRILLMEAWLAVTIVAVLGLWLILSAHNVIAKESLLSIREKQLTQSNYELQKLAELESLKKQMSDQAKLMAHLGPNVPMGRLMDTLEQMLPEGMALMDVTVEFQKGLKTQSVGRGPVVESDPTYMVVVHGVSPSDAELGNFMTGLANAIPHWIGGSMDETDVRQDGHLMRDFNFSFSIRLNDGENQDR